MPLSRPPQSHRIRSLQPAHDSVHKDPFYQVPPNTADAQPGTLLNLEAETDTSLYTIPPSLSLSRFIYQSQNPNGASVPASAYILWPYTPITFPSEEEDGYPIVAWCHGTSGINAECAPSNIRNLWHHFQVPYELALTGYVVVATDYAGLGVCKDFPGQTIRHQYLASPSLARDVIYSVIAARHAFEQLSSSKFIVMGSSLGGGAAWAVAEKLAVIENAEIEVGRGYIGTVILSPMTSVLAEVAAASSTGKGRYAFAAYLLTMMIPGIENNYPAFDRTSVLQSRGLEVLQTYTEVEGGNAVLSALDTSKITEILKPGWQDNPHIRDWQERNEVSRKLFKGPLLILQGENDPITTTPVVSKAVEETAREFPDEHVDYRILGSVTHAPVMYAGRQDYMRWIADRFRGKMLRPGLHARTVKPIRAPAQAESNFFLKRRDEAWQTI